MAGVAGHVVGVEGGDKVAEGAQSVVVLVKRILGEAFARVVGVAVELGLGNEVGASAFEHAESAVVDAGGDGGDAGAEAVVAAVADAETGAAELGAFVGAGGVGVPFDVARQMAGVVAEWLLAAVMLAGDPENALGIEVAPDGGEGIAEAEVDATEATEIRGGGREAASGGYTTGEVGIDEALEGGNCQGSTAERLIAKSWLSPRIGKMTN